MAQFTDDSVMDAALTAARGTNMYVCEGQPTNFADITARRLHATPRTPAYTGPVDGVVSGRRHTIGAQTGITVDQAATARTADHVSVDDGATLLVVTTISNAQSVQDGVQIDLGAWDHEFRDPA